jgi:hypothetical protein
MQIIGLIEDAQVKLREGLWLLRKATLQTRSLKLDKDDPGAIAAAMEGYVVRYLEAMLERAGRDPANLDGMLRRLSAAGYDDDMAPTRRVSRLDLPKPLKGQPSQPALVLVGPITCPKCLCGFMVDRQPLLNGYPDVGCPNCVAIGSLVLVTVPPHLYKP